MPIKVIEDPCFGKGSCCYEKQEWIFWKNYKASEHQLKELQKEKELYEKEKKMKTKLKKPLAL
jgi:hypothetical protein